MNKKYINGLLETFAKSQRARIMAYLRRNFPITKEDCEDIFQESFMVLYHNAHAGKLDEMTSSVQTYFTSICRNKTMELLRESGRYVSTDAADSGSPAGFSDQRIDNILSMDDDGAADEEKDRMVRAIVRDLPSPCNELLWGFYRDGLSMRELAEQYGYASESSAKVTKHRCCEKFKKRYTEMLAKLF